ncbi:MAG: hypothetical protein K6G38_02610 [Gammaproteobacteria bacterium]|nr:hypothetical protein [Gammaproteobacteria bacterium]
MKEDIDKLADLIFEASKDVLQSIFTYSEEQIKISNYLKDKKEIKEFKLKYLNLKERKNFDSLNNILKTKYGISFERSQEFEKNDLNIRIKIVNLDKYKASLSIS